MPVPASILCAFLRTEHSRQVKSGAGAGAGTSRGKGVAFGYAGLLDGLRTAARTEGIGRCPHNRPRWLCVLWVGAGMWVLVCVLCVVWCMVCVVSVGATLSNH